MIESSVVGSNPGHETYVPEQDTEMLLLLTQMYKWEPAKAETGVR